MADKSKSKVKPKYGDVPRFSLINEYEDDAKKAYQDIAINTVKKVGLRMLQMVSVTN